MNGVFIIDAVFILYHALTLFATIFTVLIFCKPSNDTTCAVRPVTNSQRGVLQQRETEEDSVWTIVEAKPVAVGTPKEKSLKERAKSLWKSKKENKSRSDKSQRVTTKKKKNTKKKLLKGKRPKEEKTQGKAEEMASTQLSAQAPSAKKVRQLNEHETQQVSAPTNSESPAVGGSPTSGEEAQATLPLARTPQMTANSAMVPLSPPVFHNEKAATPQRETKPPKVPAQEMRSTDVASGTGRYPKAIKSTAVF
uniref:Uncharacterized protein n=1 Tax=Caenorhabditis japonica TaxID=281687 RepID=A0A8R1DNS3_CAEJA